MKEFQCEKGDLWKKRSQERVNEGNPFWIEVSFDLKTNLEKQREENNQKEEEENRVKKLSSLLSKITTFHFICGVGHVATSGEISPYIRLTEN